MTLSELETRVRNFIQDKASLNKLIENDTELDSDAIAEAAEIAIVHINSIPPAFITYGSTVETFTREEWLVLGTSAFALMSAAIKQDRNYVQYNDAGLNIVLDNKSPLYNQHIANLMRLLGIQVTSTKISTNLNSFTGTSDSRTISHDLFWD